MALMQQDWCPYKKERDTRGVGAQRTCYMRTRKTTICEPKREASGENKPANTLILDFQSPNL